MSKISPIILLTIEIVAIIFFALALLQLVLRCFFKRSSFSTVSQSNRSLFPDEDAIPDSHSTFQMQLQQLFHLHDTGGVDRDIIDALPTFNYKEITGPTKEPFDCAVCLCEFSDGDSLKLLVKCSHAFHVHCIDTWLLSNSTCPLCRGTIGVGPLFAFGDTNMEERVNASFRSRGPEVLEERVFSVRLGKFRSTNEGLERGRDSESSSAGCSSSSRPRLDARRCYSMGAFRYIVVEGDLQVRLCRNEEIHGKKINCRGRGDSFSISKTWLWSKKVKFSASLDENNHVTENSNPNLGISNQY